MRPEPYTLQPNEGWVYRFGIDFVVKSSEIAAGSGVAVLEFTTRKGEEPPDHTHATEDEIFYVLAGVITFHCDGKALEVAQGGMIFLPRGIEHGYTINTDEPVRLLAITAPVREQTNGGWGGFVADMELGQGELIASPGVG